MFVLLQSGGYGVMLLQTVLALLAVCILAWVVLRWAAKKSLGLGSGQQIRVIERVVLDVGRTLYLVEVGGKVLLLGAGEGASPTLISELDAAEVDMTPEEKTSFADVLTKLRG